MGKRWGLNSPQKKIEAYIGAWGVKTGDIVDTDHLMELASEIFEVENSGDPQPMADAIQGMGPKQRKALAVKNVERVMGDVAARAPKEPPITEAGMEKMMRDSRPHMIDGERYEVDGQLDIDPAALLRKVVSAVIAHGQGHILYEYPEVLAFFKSRIPQRHEVAGMTNVDERMFEAAEKWPNRRAVR